MRIAVVNLPSVDGGGLTVLRDLHAYALLSPEHEWYFVVASQELEPGDNVQVVHVQGANASRFARLRAEMNAVPRALAGFGPDVVISLQNAPVRANGARQWVYVHQSLPFQKHYAFSLFRRDEFDSALRQRILGRWMKRSLLSAHGVFVQTEWMKDAVTSSLKNAVPVVAVGAPGAVLPTSTRQSRQECTAGPDDLTGDERREFFYPAGPAGYKNFGRLRRAFAQARTACPDIRCAVTLTEQEFRILAKVDERDPLEGIVFLGRVAHGEVLHRLACSTLVFPSFVETLGLPLAEARSSGSWILASDLPFAREVLSGYPNADFFDPFDEQALARSMVAHAQGEVPKRGDLSVERNDAQNSWARVVAAVGEAEDV